MRILVAEDCPISSTLMVETLEGAGHEVVSVADGATAWEAIERTRPPLVVLDWQMPCVDGIEVCRRIRESTGPLSETYVLIVTARDGEDDLAAALAAGADDYLAKPFDPRDLRARVEIAERRIAQATSLASATATVRVVQHRINNPLASVMAYASLCAMEPDLTADVKEMLDVIVKESRRIAEITRSMAA